jgi:two-component system alkaline phosphatase synthesis response regulator PhoP
LIPMAAILVLTGDVRQADSLRVALALDRHSVVVAPRAGSPVNVEWRPDLILVDVAEGETLDPAVLRSYSKDGRRVPSLALVTEREMFQFGNGVTDFLIKPVREAELVLRVRRLLDKNGPDDDAIMRFGELAINTGSYDVTLGGRTLDLTFTEYELLKLLASSAGKVLTRETILNEVWGYDCFVGDRTVDVHIRRLRSKIEDGGRSYIETVRNVGYRFRVA